MKEADWVVFLNIRSNQNRLKLVEITSSGGENFNWKQPHVKNSSSNKSFVEAGK